MTASKRARIRVGVAGWDYKDWHGVLYPKPKPRGFDPLKFLASYVDVIEINSTFYRPPARATSEKWVDRVSDREDFRFTAKLYRRFTHERTAAWKRPEATVIKRGMRPLLKAGRLDAMLVQFPWSFRNNETNREWLADVCDEFDEFPLVVEVRHESWNEPEFLEWLSENGVGFVNIDQPLFSKSIRPSAHATSRVGYVRVHGRNYMDWFRKAVGRDARYNYLYPVAELKPWVRRTKEVAADSAVSDVDVVFNNHYKAKAVVNALQFEKLLTRGSVTAPATLGEHYADELVEARVNIAKT